MSNKRPIIALLLITTLILAGIGVVTAYQLSRQPTTAPEEIEAAGCPEETWCGGDNQGCCTDSNGNYCCRSPAEKTSNSANKPGEGSCDCRTAVPSNDACSSTPKPNGCSCSSDSECSSTSRCVGTCQGIGSGCSCYLSGDTCIRFLGNDCSTQGWFLESELWLIGSNGNAGHIIRKERPGSGGDVLICSSRQQCYCSQIDGVITSGNNPTIGTGCAGHISCTGTLQQCQGGITPTPQITLTPSLSPTPTPTPTATVMITPTLPDTAIISDSMDGFIFGFILILSGMSLYYLGISNVIGKFYYKYLYSKISIKAQKYIFENKIRKRT